MRESNLTWELPSRYTRANALKIILSGFCGETADQAAPPIKASEDVLLGLAANALQRYAKAFGSKENFLKHLSSSDKKAVPPVLQKQPEQFEKDE